MSLADMIRGRGRESSVSKISNFSISKPASPMPTVARIATVAVATPPLTGKERAAEIENPSLPQSPPRVAEVATTGANNLHWLATYPNGRVVEVITGTTATLAELERDYPEATIELYEPVIERPRTPLSARERATIAAWLYSIGENDHEEVERVIGQCQEDAKGRRWILEQAAGLALPSLPQSPPVAAATFERVESQIGRVLVGLALLPDDRREIERRLKLLGFSFAKREAALLAYRQRWEEAAAAEPNEIKRDNAGRRAANGGLLEGRA